MNYYLLENGIITQSADFKFDDGCLETENGIVRDEMNGQLYLQSDYNALIATDDYKAKIAAKKEKEFFNNFIEISIGCLRKVPKGYSSLVEAMNGALNIVNIGGSLPAETLTIYPKPDFMTVDDIEKYLEENKFTNNAMTAKEFGTLYVEFMNAWNSQEHVS